MLSRKHYTAIARILADRMAIADYASEHVNDAYRQGARAATAATARALADYLAADNPRFDRGRFYAACKLPGGAA